jgi:hypothetical protein
MFRKLYIKLFRPTRVIATGYFSYEDADAQIKQDPRWQIGKQEDDNFEIGIVYLEKRVPVTE